MMRSYGSLQAGKQENHEIMQKEEMKARILCRLVGNKNTKEATTPRGEWRSG